MIRRFVLILMSLLIFLPYQALASSITYNYSIYLMESGNGKFKTKTVITDNRYRLDDTVDLMQATPEPYTGYYFVGWRYNGMMQNGSNMLDDSVITVTGNMYIDGVFNNTGLTVSFQTQGGSTVSPVTTSYGKTIEYPSSTRAGYTLGGWYTDAACSGDPVTFPYTVKASTTLYAKWISLSSYQVRFFDDSGNQIGATQTIDHNAFAVVPDAPEKAGYTFAGWHDGTQTLTSEQIAVKPVTTATDYTAQYSLNRYSVRFFDDADNQIGDAQTVEYNAFATVPTAPVKDGYTFVGWHDGTHTLTAEQITVKPVTAATEYTAQYSLNSYSVRFFDDADNQIGTTQTVEHNACATVPVAPEKDGHTFVGWHDGTQMLTAEQIAVKPVMIATDYTAQYSLNSYAVRFFDDADNQIGATQTVDHNACATVPDAPEKDGHTFVGWHDGAQMLTAEQIAVKPVTTTTDYTAQYSLNSYAVRFFDDAGYQIGATQTVDHNAFAMVPAAPVKDGYTFVGWYDGTQTLTAEQIAMKPVTTATDYTAQFRTNVYTVKFIDGNGDMVSIQTVPWHAPATAPQPPVRTGYVFTGWDTDFSSVVSDLTVTALFEPITKAAASAKEPEIPVAGDIEEHYTKQAAVLAANEDNIQKSGGDPAMSVEPIPNAALQAQASTPVASDLTWLWLLVCMAGASTVSWLAVILIIRARKKI